GLYPNQSAWLGWTGYLDESGRNVVYYFNVDDDTGEKLDFSPAWTERKRTAFLRRLNKIWNSSRRS
ncbi:MAG: hypothetical protein K2N29_02065, partial [Ruminiclostridium sp.]|nr:hypothetical protein [Ruminiclostridium sp.]